MSAIQVMKRETIRKVVTSKFGLYTILVIAFAFNLSSHTFAFWPGDNWWLRSAYWIIYLSMALSFIFGIYYLLEKIQLKCSDHVLFLVAIIVSWLPFGLAISMVDIATGRPATSYAIRELQSTGFLPTLLSSMAIQILPRHLMLGALIYVIRFYVTVGPTSSSIESREQQVVMVDVDDNVGQQFIQQAAFVKKLSSVVREAPQLLQAQEHYLKVTTVRGSELILYKLSQAISEMPDEYGIQIHRSYWVAKKNICGWQLIDNGVKVILSHGGSAPVSRRFEHYVKQEFSEITA